MNEPTEAIMGTEVRERPILMSEPMVTALNEGRKTQTRRIVKIKGDSPKTIFPLIGRDNSPTGEWFFSDPVYDRVGRSGNFCPYGKPGDRLWVKEAYYAWGKWVPNGTRPSGRKAWKFVQVGTSLRYMDGNKPSKTAKRDGECGWVYRHGRFMPKAHSRITLEITEVRVERLQGISEEDAIAEGATLEDRGYPPYIGYRGGYYDLWESINGPGSWYANPWVWVISFRQVGGNHDGK